MGYDIRQRLRQVLTRETNSPAPSPVNPNDVRQLAMPFAREWVCACGSKLKIRTREDRGEGASNYRPGRVDAKGDVHATLQAGELNWEGLREERGWIRHVDGALRCPACARNLTIDDYKQRRRDLNQLDAMIKQHQGVQLDPGLKSKVDAELRRQLAQIKASLELPKA